jgi:hypothetical protein
MMTSSPEADNIHTPAPNRTRMKITAPDFFTAFFSALALAPDRQPTYECGERFCEALETAYDSFAKSAEAEGYKPNFLIQVNPLHGDSSVIEEGIAAGIRRDLVSLDNPNFHKIRLIVPENEARENLQFAAGGAKLYEKLVADFVSHFSSAPQLR